MLNSNSSLINSNSRIGVECKIFAEIIAEFSEKHFNRKPHFLKSPYSPKGFTLWKMFFLLGEFYIPGLGIYVPGFGTYVPRLGIYVSGLGT